MKKIKASFKVAFTLAEVLITLTIIGVVAALTIPTLVQSYKKSVVETKLAKFYSVMNNAIRMAEVEYGPQNTWMDYYEEGEVDEDGIGKYDKGDKYDVVVKKYFAPYLKIMDSEEIENVVIGPPQKVYYLSDGSAFSFSLHENREIYFYSENPKKCLKKSDADGICRFVFVFMPVSDELYSVHYKYNIAKGMQPSLYQWNGKVESLMNDSTRGCKNSVKHPNNYCTAIIQRNGWKIPKDYPHKF